MLITEAIILSLTAVAVYTTIGFHIITEDVPEPLGPMFWPVYLIILFIVFAITQEDTITLHDADKIEAAKARSALINTAAEISDDKEWQEVGHP